jgi:hypothetical protein
VTTADKHSSVGWVAGLVVVAFVAFGYTALSFLGFLK